MLPPAGGIGDGHRRLERDQGRAAVHRRHAGDQIAAERAEIARLHRADGMGGLDQSREHVADDRRAHDFAVRGQGADVQPVVGDGDLFEFAQPRDVDDHFRTVDGVLELDQQVGAAGQNLGLGAVLAEQRHGVPDVFSHYVSERLHPVVLMPADGALQQPSRKPSIRSENSHLGCN